MESVTVTIASYLEPEHVRRIAAVDPRVHVRYAPDLLAPPRFAADHTGRPEFRRTPEQEHRFLEHLAAADVLYDVDRALAARLPELAPRLRWIQFTSSGVGPFVLKNGLNRPEWQLTNAAGIHAVPLAEHALLSLLYFWKDVPARLRDQRAHVWERYAGRELRGATVLVVGMGAVGQEVARTCRANGLRVIGMRRSPVADPAALHADAVVAPDRLLEVLPTVDAVVLIAPHTPETEGMFGADAFTAMKPGSVLINIARGQLVDEAALVAALRSGHLGGAAIDVATVEPLATESPLWDLPNVFITAHSASTVDTENERLTDLFCDNLRRFLDGAPLRNVLKL
jgi:phosphoglycerate dehydrogenase-like enzyme